MLDLRVHGVLVDRRLHRRAVLQRVVGHCQAFGLDVTAVGTVHGKAATALLLLAFGGEHRREVHVTRLVVGRVGVGDVVGQHFGALGAEAQGLLVDTKRLVEADAHVRETFGG
ncbi:hypothetical protein D3C80_1888430 [compost metagenome]